MPLTGQGQVQDASTSQDVVEAVFTIDGTQLTIEEAKKRCKRCANLERRSSSILTGMYQLPLSSNTLKSYFASSCCRMMVAGFFLLPWMWVVNVRTRICCFGTLLAVHDAALALASVLLLNAPQVWYFWPIFREGQHFPDTTMRGMLRISAIGASVCVGAVMVWLVIFVSVPSKGIFYDLDVRRIPKIDL